MEAWQRLRSRGDGWYWMIRGARHGDLYHICSLAPAFAALHGRDLPIYLVADRAGQAAVASLFGDAFAEIIVDDSFPAEREAWELLFADEQLPWFGPNAPLFLHPTMVLDPTRMTIPFAQENGLTWMQIYKNILRLPGDAEPAAPPVRLDLAVRARALCREVGIVGGRSVILFPYAQSLPVDALAHFAVLARDLAAEGMLVFTSVSGDEVPVEGTSPVAIPFDLLLDVAEHAGRIVAVRSGISDITSSARCDKTYVYPGAYELKPWSMSALGYAHDAHEIAFDFRGGDGALFSAAVRSGADLSALAAPPRHLSAFVGAPMYEAHVQAVSMTDALAGVDLIPGEPGSALVIHGVAPRDHGRLRSGMSQVFAALVRRYGDAARFYACRDNGLVDFFEEIEGEDLSVGRYVAGRFWHSVIVTIGAPLDDFLAPVAREKILEASHAAAGAKARPGDAVGTADGMAAIVRTRPLAVNGVQFLEGWSTLEPWGVWSDHQRVTLKAIAAAPLPGGAVLRLTLDAATFDERAFDSLAVSVNDRPVDVAYKRGEGRVVTALVPLGQSRRVFYLRFVFHGLRSPLERGIGGDTRALGVGVIDAEIVAAPDLARSAEVGAPADLSSE